MIFVAENNQARQFELLALIASGNDCNLVAWLYPESRATELLGLPTMQNVPPLQPVTTYADGTEQQRTDVIRASSRTLPVLVKHAAQLKKHCDSLALYKPGTSEWIACTIGHEGMGLVRDRAAIRTLTANGFSASLQAPAWW